jgi:pimeloyl-ACP methyl ester carboxylesterase
MAERFKTEREAYPIVFTEQAGFKDTYGGAEGIVVLEAHRIRPRESASDTVLMFMHPIGGGAYLPMVHELAKQGHHVIYANSRYRGADYGLIMEKVVLDLGQAIADAKRRFGYERVVLCGWSGGGSLSLYYQQQAERPTVSATPAGDPPSLVDAELDPADAILLLAAHPSRHQVLTDCLDAAIVDEDDPSQRDPELDLFALEPPFDAALLERYREAQLARNRRITAWVKETLASLAPNEERGFVVHGTMGDPRALDPAVDPNERTPGVSFLGDPRVVNNGPVGLARFCSLRSWLSQWSFDDANGDGPRAARDISIPALVIQNDADEICTPGYANALFEAVGTEDKALHRIAGANHYYIGPDQVEKLRESAAFCVDWLAQRGFAPVGQPLTS